MRCMPSGCKGCVPPRSPASWGDIGARSRASSRGTASRAMAITSRAPRTRTRARDGRIRGATRGSRWTSGRALTRCSVLIGARSKLPVGTRASTGCRSAMKPSTATSGVTRNKAGRCTCICDARTNRFGSATRIMTVEENSPASVPLRRVRRAPKTAHDWGTGKAIPYLGTARAGRVYSPSSIANRVSR